MEPTDGTPAVGTGENVPQMPVLADDAETARQQQAFVQAQEEERQRVDAQAILIYNKLKSDLEEFEGHGSYLDVVPHNQVSDGEIRARLQSLNRLHDGILSTFRHLKSFPLTVDQRTNVELKAKNFSSSSYATIGKFLDLQASRNKPQVQVDSKNILKSSEDNFGGVRVKLPDFKLPEFDGSLDKWLTWRDTYDSLIHRNPNLSKVVKHHYLRGAMKFPSGQQNVLNNFPFNEDSYDEAWKALCERYDDKRKLKSQLFNSLMTVKKMSGDSPSEVRRMLDSFASIVTSLDLLNCTYNDLLVHIVQFRLDDQTSKEWQKFIGKGDPSFEDMKDFLTEYWHTLDSLPSNAKRQYSVKANDNKSSSSSSKTFSAPSAPSSSSVCQLCKEAHYLYQCQKFKLLSVPERYKIVNENRLCRNCFSPAHMQRTCTSIHRCSHCRQNHHSLLHSARVNSSEAPAAQSVRSSTHQGSSNHTVEVFQPMPTPRISYPPRSNSSTTDLHSTELKSFASSFEALLSTVTVLVLDVNNNWKPCRALMDSGSQSNYISSGFAQRLGIELIPTHQPVIGINGQTSVIKHRTKAIFSSRYRQFQGSIECCVSDDITGFLPTRPIDVSKLKIPSELFLADPEFHKPGKIDMLLGTGIYHDSQLGNVIKQKDMPVLIETEFGWIVGGNFPVSSPPSSSTLVSCFTQFPNSGLEVLDQKLDKFMELENYGTKQKILSQEEKHCLDFHLRTTTQDESGRRFVQHPFKAAIEDLGTNWANSMRQFYYQEKLRQEDEELNRLYCDYMSEFITSSHMSEVSELLKHEGYYLPHHGVKKISSTTTKLRPVFNGSSKSETGLSLNDCLCVGPTVQPDSFDILLRFREKQFVLKSDIEKMYRQVFLVPAHRKYQKILWRFSPSEPLKHYTLNTVTFGLSPAPFQATNTLNRIADEFSDRFPDASKIIKSSFYVDDLVFSFDTIAEGKRLRDQLRYMLSSSCFPMRKWSANHPDLLLDLPQKDIETVETDSTVIKTLGVVWNPKTDNISFSMKPLGECPTTKAGVLSEIASIYDPIGLIGPVILLAKLHMRPLRQMKWNQELSDDDKTHWNDFRSKLITLNDIKVPRHAVAVNAVNIQLHGFCDASEDAFGAVLYLRSCDSLGNIQVSLICSKSRVSPLKQKSIARLELCAATLLSRLVAKILEIITLPISQVILWSDSMIVLYWIATESARLSTFVGNRVSVIQELTEFFIWRHIRGLFNPGDLISRGLMPDVIKLCLLWWNGPEFLLKSPSEWPESLLTINNDDPELAKELRKTFIVSQPSNILNLIETRFSSLQKLLNCFAYIRRFATKNSCKGPLTIDELETAEITIIRVLQQTMFPLEHKFFMRQRENPEPTENFPLKSSLLSLTPFMDEDCLMRVGGRIQASPGLTEQQKHQIIVPKCHFATLIVRNMHKKFLHPGQSAMLSHVRGNYWIIRCKDIVRKVQNECLVCFRVKPKFPTQIMGSLPAARVTMAPTFISTAVDYAGPFSMRTSLTKKSSMTKVWVAMFKCMATGAIHLEAVTGLSTKAFNATFDRFISRRGLCRDIFSDNGTEFVGANNDFQRVLKEIESEIGEFLKEKLIRWHFTTPVAPHAGGYYESGIKSMKHHLVRECADRSFDFEQFSTLLCKIEAIINSRPLTPLSDDPQDLGVLTPAHFLIGRPMVAKPERNFIPVKMNRLDRFNQLQQLQQKLWDRWYHEYLHHLQTRPNHFREQNEFREGDMVLVKDQNLPPLKWLMGRVVKVLPDKKGVVRNVIVKTPTGEKHRHIRYLAFLPLEKS